MKPAFESLRARAPDVSVALLREHVERLDERYFESFSEADVVAHVRGLSRLTRRRPVEFLAEPTHDGGLDLTVLAFDYPAAFSLITGILASSDFEVLSGDIFTYAPSRQPDHHPRVWRRLALRRRVAEPRRRRIVDRFAGRLAADVPVEEWIEATREKLAALFLLLEAKSEDAFTRARQRVNEMVAEALGRRRVDPDSALYPVHIEVDNDSPHATRMCVVSVDTPFFLYTLSAALALRDVSIDQVRIRTIGSRIEDEFFFVNASGGKVLQQDRLDQIQLSVLLTKQFTYFLGRAPDPYAALCRFEQLVKQIQETPGKGSWAELLADRRVMQELARLLGASDFLWEDFIRLHYETLLPMLRPHIEGRRFSEPIETLDARLRAALEDARTLDEKRRRLNEFKDRETFLIDLDHILTPGSDFREMGDRLTALAESVVNAATEMARAELVVRFGDPRTVAGLPARFAILGLGKFGGAALGYASDIELLYVYSDTGQTAGPEVIGNAEFFERLVRDAVGLIEAKREGIFQTDLRLRPYGKQGPLACSLDSFCRYYGRGGAAHAYERLALVRMRAVGGDPTLGAHIERIRDEIVYASRSISFEDVRELREKQLQEMTRGGRVNAKFSPGALVDLEYAAQILQVTYGRERPALKTPRIHEALKALAAAGALEPDEADRLLAAYDFLRRLINALRMLRGSAKDLFLPPQDSDEYVHLARRMGYEPGPGQSPAQRLHVEFETRTAVVRAFVERRLGRESLPGPATGNVADLVLSDKVPDDLRDRILTEAGFRDPARAAVNLRRLAGDGERRQLFAWLAVPAGDVLARRPDPDMALNNWERFVATLDDPEAHFRRLLEQPMRLEILLSIFAGSQFLADTLVRDPEFFEWVADPDRLHRVRGREEIEADLRELSRSAEAEPEWLDAIRRLRRREILRIATRDICLARPTRDITLELSNLAGALVQVCLERVLANAEDALAPIEAARDRFCVIAMGKLGGEELNYSSDIDLIGLYDDDGPGWDAPECGDRFGKVMERLREQLSNYTSEGYVYRVDLRLRAYGRVGRLARSITSLERYYRSSAAPWELQALLKARPVAGALSVGADFLQRVLPLLMAPRDRAEVADVIERMRRESVRAASRSHRRATDVKNGPGGLRDVEFLAQGLQLIHAPERPELLDGNTLRALEELGRAGILPEETAETLAKDYLFLRRVEHCLQLFEDRQTHALPADPTQLDALAKRMLGIEATADTFTEKLQACLTRVREAYETYLLRA